MHIEQIRHNNAIIADIKNISITSYYHMKMLKNGEECQKISKYNMIDRGEY